MWQLKKYNVTVKRILLITLGVIMLISGCAKENTFEAGEATSLQDYEDHTPIDNNEDIYENIEPEQHYETIMGDREQLHNFSDGVAWIMWEGQWICIDTNGNILFAMDYIYEPVTDFINGYAVVQLSNVENDEKSIFSKRERILVDKSGTPIMGEWLTDGEERLLKIGKNKDSIDVWFLVVKDSYSTHQEYIKVLNRFKGVDESGEIECEKIVCYDMPKNFQKYYDILNIGDGIYTLKYWEAQSRGTRIYNTNELGVKEDSNQNNTEIVNYGHYAYIDNCRIEEGHNQLGFYDEVISGNGGLVDAKGNLLRKVYEPGINNTVFMGSYSEGVYSSGNRKNYRLVCEGFYDFDGNKVVDLNGYVTKWPPFYKNGYCVLQLKNDAGVDFYTILDKEGNLLFEPKRGCAMGDDLNSACYVTEDVIIVLDENGTYKYVDTMGNDVLIDYQYFLDSNGGGALGKFYDGLARVAVDRDGMRRYIYINRQGDELKLDLSHWDRQNFTKWNPM